MEEVEIFMSGSIETDRRFIVDRVFLNSVMAENYARQSWEGGSRRYTWCVYRCKIGEPFINWVMECSFAAERKIKGSI